MWCKQIPDDIRLFLSEKGCLRDHLDTFFDNPRGRDGEFTVSHFVIKLTDLNNVDPTNMCCTNCMKRLPEPKTPSRPERVTVVDARTPGTPNEGGKRKLRPRAPRPTSPSPLPRTPNPHRPMLLSSTDIMSASQGSGREREADDEAGAASAVGGDGNNNSLSVRQGDEDDGDENEDENAIADEGTGGESDGEEGDLDDYDPHADADEHLSSDKADDKVKSKSKRHINRKAGPQSEAKAFLQQWRDETYEKVYRGSYTTKQILLPDATLESMAKWRDLTMDEDQAALRKLWGAWAEDYGPEVVLGLLEIDQRFLDAAEAEEKKKAALKAKAEAERQAKAEQKKREEEERARARLHKPANRTGPGPATPPVRTLAPTFIPSPYYYPLNALSAFYSPQQRIPLPLSTGTQPNIDLLSPRTDQNFQPPLPFDVYRRLISMRPGQPPAASIPHSTLPLLVLVVFRILIL